MKSIKKVFLTSILYLFYALPVWAQYGLEETADAAKISKNTNLPSIIGSIIGYALGFIGVIFLILMIYGGGIWMTAQGNEQKVTKAKETIIAAVIGLIIVLAAYAITTFVVGALTAEPPATS